MKEEIPTESGTPGHDHMTLETTCLNACALAMERESGLVNQLVSQCLPVHLSLQTVSRLIAIPSNLCKVVCKQLQCSNNYLRYFKIS